jgi:DNA/RNA endonuclease G (NUC1)
MSKKGKQRRRSSRLKRVIMLALLYVVLAVVYYFLPWTVRKPVYENVPWLDASLRKSGFRMLVTWDDLGVIGSDCRVSVEPFLAGDDCYGGFPSQGFQLTGRVTQLESRGFVVGYSESKSNPLWVAYRVFDVPDLAHGKRPSRFRTDQRTRSLVRHDDYTHSGYDRGHMAPNFAIATRYGDAAQEETFLMSNIIPQTPHVNRHLWKDLEMSVAKRYGRCFGEVWVVTGPVFEPPFEKLKSGVSIPSAYYKIIADEHDGYLRVMAFLVEKDCPPYTRIKTRLVSVDRIEELTGLDFFPKLSDAAQTELESKPAGRLWPSLVSSVRYRLKGNKPKND